MKKQNYKVIYFLFTWHAFFLALTMSMLDLNTVFPSLVSELTKSKIIFGILYSIMLGVPLIFNIIFSHYLKTFKYKKKFLLIGIYLRSFSFLGMAFFTYYFGETYPKLTLYSFFFWVFLFSISAGFAGISYADIIGKMLDGKRRTELYAFKQFFGSFAAFLGGVAISKIFSISSLGYPINYAISLAIGFIGISVASLGFLLIKEPPSEVVHIKNDTFISYLKNVPKILRQDKKFRKFIIVENLASFSIMIFPFYMIFAKDIFRIDSSYIGKYLIFQIIGTIFSNFIWIFIAKRYNSKTIIRICITLGGLIPIIAIILSNLGADYFVIVFILIGFIISGRRVGFEPYLLDIAPSNRRTEYLGINGTLNIFIVILPILGGTVIGLIGYYFTFIMVALAMFMALILFNSKNEV